MKLLTNEIENRLSQKSLYTAYEEGLNAKVITKFFNPTGNEKWLITGGDKLPDGDWLFYGLRYMQYWEIGTFLLSELESLECDYGLRVEGDLQYNGNETLNEAYLELA